MLLEKKVVMEEVVRSLKEKDVEIIDVEIFLKEEASYVDNVLTALIEALEDEIGYAVDDILWEMGLWMNNMENEDE